MKHFQEKKSIHSFFLILFFVYFLIFNQNFFVLAEKVQPLPKKFTPVLG